MTVATLQFILRNAIHVYLFVFRIRELRNSRIGTLMRISGQVVRTHPVHPELVSGTFVCLDCQTVIKDVEQQFKFVQVNSTDVIKIIQNVCILLICSICVRYYAASMKNFQVHSCWAIFKNIQPRLAWSAQIWPHRPGPYSLLVCGCKPVYGLNDLLPSGSLRFKLTVSCSFWAAKPVHCFKEESCRFLASFHGSDVSNTLIRKCGQRYFRSEPLFRKLFYFLHCTAESFFIAGL